MIYSFVIIESHFFIINELRANLRDEEGARVFAFQLGAGRLKHFTILPYAALPNCSVLFTRSHWHVFFSGPPATRGLEVFRCCFVRPFSRRFEAKKQVSAQSGFVGVELLENFITSWV